MREQLQTGPAKYHVFTGELKEERAVVATKRTCSARCELNMGLPCRHILRVHVAENSDELDADLIHPFWRERDGSEDDSEDDGECGCGRDPGEIGCAASCSGRELVP